MTGRGAIAAAVSVLLLAGCSSGSTGPTVASSPAPSSLSGRRIGLQLRPVLDARASTGTACPGSGSPAPTDDAPATRSPVTACSADATIVYSLGAAVVEGTQWQSLAASERDGSVVLVALADPFGSSALTRASGDLATEDDPRNQLAVYAEGVVLAAPTVVQPLYGGALVVPWGSSLTEAQALVDRLTR